MQNFLSIFLQIFAVGTQKIREHVFLDFPKKCEFHIFTFHIGNMESIGFTCSKKYFLLQIFTFSDFLYKKKFRTKKNFRLSRGDAVRALVKFCNEDNSAVRATDLRFRLPFVIWAGLIHLILRILKF
jgi:hypothetical protein